MRAVSISMRCHEYNCVEGTKTAHFPNNVKLTYYPSRKVTLCTAPFMGRKNACTNLKCPFNPDRPEYAIRYGEFLPNQTYSRKSHIVPTLSMSALCGFIPVSNWTAPLSHDPQNADCKKCRKAHGLPVGD